MLQGLLPRWPSGKSRSSVAFGSEANEDSEHRMRTGTLRSTIVHIPNRSDGRAVESVKNGELISNGYSVKTVITPGKCSPPERDQSGVAVTEPVLKHFRPIRNSIGELDYNSSISSDDSASGYVAVNSGLNPYSTVKPRCPHPSRSQIGRSLPPLPEKSPPPLHRPRMRPQLSRAASETAALTVVGTSSAKLPMKCESSGSDGSLSTRGVCGATKRGGFLHNTLRLRRDIADRNSGCEGAQGFEDLRKYMKQGNEFCKEISNVMQERADLELTYSKSLSKLSAKLNKATKDFPECKTTSQSFQAIAVEMEIESDAHKALSTSLLDDLVKPLKNTAETHAKARKTVEIQVDKTSKTLNDLMISELKAKKTCYTNARDNERMQDLVLDVKVGSKAKTITEKDISKLESKKRKSEEAMKKADFEYYTYCVHAERARLEWETAVRRAGDQFNTLEQDRLASVQDTMSKYCQAMHTHAPKINQSCERLNDNIGNVKVESDIQNMVSYRSKLLQSPEQILPDFYAEDKKNPMHRERRREALDKMVILLKLDLDKEKKGKQGLEKLALALKQQPTFGDSESQQDVQDKLLHMKAMLAYLEAVKYKVESNLADMEGRRSQLAYHPLANHIETHRDKQGYPHTVLKLPDWILGQGSASSSPTSDQSDSGCDTPPDVLVNSMGDVRGVGGDSNSVYQDNYDEFSDYSLEDDLPSEQGSSEHYAKIEPQSTFCYGEQQPANHKKAQVAPASGGSFSCCNNYGPVRRPAFYCKAIYEYEANFHDEITIATGDVIGVFDEHENGWWEGELNGKIGLFPSTYVQKIGD